MNIVDIKSNSDLRMFSFGDLFYEIFEGGKSEALVMSIINSLDPKFSDENKKCRISAAKLALIQDYLTSEHELQSFRGRMSNALKESLPTGFQYDLISSIMDIREVSDETIDSRLDQVYGQIEVVENGYAFDDTAFMAFLNNLKMECYRISTEKTNDGKGLFDNRGVIAAYIGRDEDKYTRFSNTLDARIIFEASVYLDRDKILKALYLLPLIKTDQELLVFFGNNFHVTFSNVDAYTGLLYASEFFDFEGSAINELSKNFTTAETESARKDVIKECKEYEDKLRIKQEQEQKDRDYYKAMKEMSLSQNYYNHSDEYVLRCYRNAKDIFVALGNYRDSKNKLKEIYEFEKKIAEKERKEQKYFKAEELYEAMNFEAALVEFKSIGKFRDSAEKAKKVEKEIEEQNSRAQKYESAISLLDKGEFKEAARLFERLSWNSDYNRSYYTEACDMLRKIRAIHPFYWINQIGDIGSAGYLPQWTVLDIRDTMALIIPHNSVFDNYSVSSHDKQSFDDSSNQWATSKIRVTLNAANREDEGYGLTCYRFPATWQRATQDVDGERVFLLSVDEAKRYFPTINSRKVCEMTISSGIRHIGDESAPWWLRSAGSRGSKYAAYVKKDGSINSKGIDIADTEVYIRPAVWVSLIPTVSDPSTIKNLSMDDIDTLWNKREKEETMKREAAKRKAKLEKAALDEKRKQKAKLKRIAEQESKAKELEAQVSKWEEAGLCRLCGGELSLFSKKCKLCGVQK